MKYVLGALTIIILSIFLLLFIIPNGVIFPTLNCIAQDIDINAGQKRHQRYFLGIKLEERIEDTEISKMYKKLVGPLPEPDWRRVNTFSPPSNKVSPHHKFHGVFADLYFLEDAFKRGNFADDAKKTILLNFFKLYKVHNTDYYAGEYGNDIYSLAIESDKNKPLINIKDLPPLPQQQRNQIP